MSLYTLSEFMTIIKENMGISELPKTITDKMMIERFQNSALKTFSQLCPVVNTVLINDNELIKDETLEKNYTPNGNFYRYRIPKFAFGDATIIGVPNVQPVRANVCNDYFLGYGGMGAGASLDTLMAVASVRQAATVLQQCYPALTWEFRGPDILTLFNSYCGETYQVELMLSHDVNLSTIPADAFFNLEQIAVLDMQEYFYNKLKRYQRTNIGVGDVELNIDDWSGARQDKISLVKELAEDANLDYDHIRIF